MKTYKVQMIFGGKTDTLVSTEDFEKAKKHFEANKHYCAFGATVRLVATETAIVKEAIAFE